MNFLDAAAIYAQLGFKVIPLRPMSKETFAGIGVYEATDDMAQLEKWHNECPTSNVAAGCGPESGILVVDVDKHHGGDKALADLIKQHGDIPNCPMSETPQGGWHLFFRYESRVGNSVGVLGRGLDVKSKGGYIVLPPSRWNGVKRGKKICDGGNYKWIRACRGTALPNMPGWMLKKLLPKETPPFAKQCIDHSNADVCQVEWLLGSIPNHAYGLWLKIGMALKDHFGNDGFALWVNWSGKGYGGFSRKECEAKWKSFKRTGVGLGSVFYEARLAGANFADMPK